MYIWVVNRFGIFVGVIHRVNGIKPSTHTMSVTEVLDNTGNPTDVREPALLLNPLLEFHLIFMYFTTSSVPIFVFNFQQQVRAPGLLC